MLPVVGKYDEWCAASNGNVWKKRLVPFITRYEWEHVIQMGQVSSRMNGTARMEEYPKTTKLPCRFKKKIIIAQMNAHSMVIMFICQTPKFDLISN